MDTSDVFYEMIHESGNVVDEFDTLDDAVQCMTTYFSPGEVTILRCWDQGDHCERVDL